jgi:hypothetical protein
MWNSDIFKNFESSGGVIKYVISSNYAIHLVAEKAGVVKIGYIKNLASGATTDLPSTMNVYIEKVLTIR